MTTKMLFSLLVLARLSAAQPAPMATRDAPDAPVDFVPPPPVDFMPPPPPPPQPAAGLDAAENGTLVPPTVVGTMPLNGTVVEMTAGSKNVTMVLSTGNQKQQASVIAYPSECVDTADDVAKNLLNGSCSFSWAVHRAATVLCSWAWHGSRPS